MFDGGVVTDRAMGQKTVRQLLATRLNTFRAFIGNKLKRLNLNMQIYIVNLTHKKRAICKYIRNEQFVNVYVSNYVSGHSRLCPNMLLNDTSVNIIGNNTK